METRLARQHHSQEGRQRQTGRVLPDLQILRKRKLHSNREGVFLAVSLHHGTDMIQDHDVQAEHVDEYPKAESYNTCSVVGLEAAHDRLTDQEHERVKRVKRAHDLLYIKDAHATLLHTKSANKVKAGWYTNFRS